MNEAPYSTRTVWIVSLIVITAIIAGGILLLTTQPDPVKVTVNLPSATETPAPSPTPGPILVYVTGAVAEPQTTVALPAGSRVQDALDAVGGVNEGMADMDRVNIAAILQDGDQVHVYTMDESEEAIDPVLPTPSGGIVIHINTATVEELVTLPGIGPSIAQRIIDYREANGPFADLDALDAVNGIGPALLENIQGLISFD